MEDRFPIRARRLNDMTKMSGKCANGCKCKRHIPTGGRKPYFWDNEKLAIIKANYDGSMKSRAELAERFGVSRIALWHILHRSGLLMRGWKSHWTEEEVEKLIELVPRMRLGEVAQEMGRSINIITAKMCHLRRQGVHISLKYRDEWYTAEEIAMILGVDPQRITGYIRSGKLKAEPHDPSNPPAKNSGGMWRISLRRFRRFLHDYPDDITVRRNVDFPVLIDVLTR